MNLEARRRWAGRLGPLAVVAALLAWLWPIGLGGAMPVGGDVTRFQIGLMAVLSEALQAGRLPLWNDRWGFGFPGLAESQMGVYYPPHLLLYGSLPVETAYTASLVLHVCWGGLGARWAARRFGASQLGAMTAGIAWAASGFMLVHLPHQWAYTVGSWAPWAWGLGWSILSGEGGRRAPWLLAALLAIQVLPGHFQLAFCTEVGLVVMAAGAIVATPSRVETARRSSAVGLALLAMVPLAAAQVVPTFRLARLADAQRDYEYLSGFAATPLHLVSYVAPDLFHRSPLWRPVAWDPFHTSPEEHLAYLGLVPLFLAIAAIARPGRRRREVRVLAIVAGAGLLLSLGPYVPGFAAYCRLPGFSFFRAPARWALVTTLAPAILAGLGVDAIREGRLRHPRRWLVGFVVAASAWIAAVVGLFEVGLWSTGRPGHPAIVGVYQQVFALLPWDHDDEIVDVMDRARRGQDDFRVIAGQANEGLGPVPKGGLRLDRQRFAIYGAELGTTGALLVALLALAVAARGGRAFVAGLLVIGAVDLGLLARHRPIDADPLGPLTEQSAVLGRLDDRPDGTRVLDPSGNLAMVAGSSPVASYRTLDLPALVGLTGLAGGGPADAAAAREILEALRAVGARVKVLGPYEAGAVALADRFAATGRDVEPELVADPALTAWLLGAGYARSPRGRDAEYLLIDAGPTARAWLLPDPAGDRLARLAASDGTPSAVAIAATAAGRPLAIVVEAPEHVAITATAEGPAVLLIARLDHPEWRASLIGPDGAANPARIVRVLGGWQAVRLPGAGRWFVRLDYRGGPERWGLALSALAWAGWGLGLWRARPGRMVEEPTATSDPEQDR